MANKTLEFSLSAEDKMAGYLSLPDHPGEGLLGVTSRQLRLIDLCGAYKGPDIYFDFDKENRLIGIEVIGQS
jgi:hypothetical protein